MNKLFGLFLLAVAFLAPVGAEAANRFAVCTTTCTWDNSSTAMWSTASGGATGASAPTSADAVIIDAATCVGGTTCTITTFAGIISAQTITWGACTASTTGCIIDASANNTNFTISSAGADAFSGTGTGTRKWLGGTGTYALTNSGTNDCIDMSTTTNDQGSVFSGATWSCSGTSSSATRNWNGGGFSYGPTTFNANTSRGALGIGGSNTFASLTINGPQQIIVGANQTITGALTLTGVSNSQPVQFNSNSLSTARTISIGSASTGTWASLRDITTSGAAALTVSNCFDNGNVTLANGGACNTPAGGAAGGKIIGG